jgi:hypothetical protein
MKNYILIISVLLITNSLYAQRQYLDKNKIYPTAKIYQKNKSEVLKVSNLKIQNDTLILFQGGPSGLMQLTSSNVRYIAIKKGTYAGTYALAGGGIGLLSSLYGVLSVKSDPTLDDTGVNWAPFVIGFTAGGTALGALIGATKTKWQNYYIKDNKTSFTLRVSPNYSKNYCGVSVKLNF